MSKRQFKSHTPSLAILYSIFIILGSKIVEGQTFLNTFLQASVWNTEYGFPESGGKEETGAGAGAGEERQMHERNERERKDRAMHTSKERKEGKKRREKKFAVSFMSNILSWRILMCLYYGMHFMLQ